jgi:hypothetical protein
MSTFDNQRNVPFNFFELVVIPTTSNINNEFIFRILKNDPMWLPIYEECRKNGDGFFFNLVKAL